MALRQSDGPSALKLSVWSVTGSYLKLQVKTLWSIRHAALSRSTGWAIIDPREPHGVFSGGSGR